MKADASKSSTPRRTPKSRVVDRTSDRPRLGLHPGRLALGVRRRRRHRAVASAGRSLPVENGTGSEQDVRRLSHFRELRISPHPVWQVEFLPDGKTLATWAEDGVIRFVRSEDGAEQGRIESPDEKINAMALAPDGTWLVTGGEDGGIGIWDVATSRCLHRFAKDNRYQIKVVALSGDGQRLATGGTDKQVQIWDVSDPASPRLLLRGNHYDRLQALAFSADSRTLAACDKSGSLRLWPVPAAGESVVDSPPARIWQAHDGRANSVAFHPTKNELASAGQESHVAIWDLASSVEPRTLDEARRSERARANAGLHARRSLLGRARPSRRASLERSDRKTGTYPRRLRFARRSRRHFPRRPPAGGRPQGRRDGGVVGPGQPAPSRPRSARVSDPAETADRRSPEDQETVGQPTGSVQRPAAAPIVTPRWQITNQPCDRLVFSPDSTLVAAVSYDRDEVAIYAAATGQDSATDPRHAVPRRRLLAGRPLAGVHRPGQRDPLGLAAAPPGPRPDRPHQHGHLRRLSARTAAR